MLQHILKENGLASIERGQSTKGGIIVVVVAHINRDGEQTGKYQIQLSHFMKKPHETRECESYDDLVAKLLPGEAESEEWCDM